MVESERDASTGATRFVLSANGAMSRRQITVFLCAAGCAMLAIAAGFSYLGLWLVLPFSGAEWLLLVYGFNVSHANAQKREVVTIDGATVLLEKGSDRPEQVYRFQRAWLTLDWTRPSFSGHPSRLAFRSHGKSVEVGEFLAEAERETLVRELRQILMNNNFA
jgi:uncharacterized membrane protein